MTSKPVRFILLLQRNWTDSPVPTGDKMCAFVYNNMPEYAKAMFQVNFINAGNIRQVQYAFPFLSGTPQMYDAQTNVAVDSGDPTIFALMHLAYNIGVKVNLTQMHPVCSSYDARFQDMIAQRVQQDGPMAPRSSAPYLQLPKSNDEIVPFLQEVKRRYGEIPEQLMIEANIRLSKGSKLTSDNIQSLMYIPPKAREELEKLGYSVLGDPFKVGALAKQVKLPFCDSCMDDDCDAVTMTSSVESSLNGIDQEVSLQDELHRHEKNTSVDASTNASSQHGLVGISNDAMTRLYQMKQNLEARYGSLAYNVKKDEGSMLPMTYSPYVYRAYALMAPTMPLYYGYSHMQMQQMAPAVSGMGYGQMGGYMGGYMGGHMGGYMGGQMAPGYVAHGMVGMRYFQ